ncbi:MAG: Na+-transporting NADH:ubiquinone oxidoreductase subunit A [Rhodothermales bacterium]|jgi:Na+-transporting NADH:ubiquinone oxidoreductase subunit A
MASITLKAGYDVPIAGDPTREVVNAPAARTVGIDPREFRGIRPKLIVKKGDAVKAGSPLFFAKGNEDYVFTSPVSGKVSELTGITRGAKRVITAITIENDLENEAVDFAKFAPSALANANRDKLMAELTKSGQLAHFKTRPFAHVAQPDQMPRDIFVSAIDSAPLSPDSNLLLEKNETYFQAGIDAASRLTDGRVHLSIDGLRSGISSALRDAKNCDIHRFSGKHPIGAVGVQIHHIAPINGKTDTVWTISVQGLIQIGRFLIEGRVSAQKIVAVTGTSSTDRRHFRTINGANVESLVAGNVEDGAVRFISGDVLTGTTIASDGFVGFYDDQLTLIPESPGDEFVGWMKPGWDKASIYRTFLSPFLPKRKFEMSTSMQGGHRAFVLTGYYERVLPMDIYPLQLFKMCLAQDVEEMENFGIYELTEEEVALCEYICPSKSNLSQLVRDSLELMHKEA